MHRTLRQPSTDLTPFQCVLRYQPPLFPWSGEPSEVPAVTHWLQESERVWDSAHQHLKRAVRCHKHHADVQRATTPTYHPGQKVWLSTRDIRLRLPCKKLSPRFIGPFPITRHVNPVMYELKLPSQNRIHPTMQCLSAQALPLTSFSCFHRAWSRRQTPSPDRARGWNGLLGKGDTAFPTLWG